ncbi:MAG: alpha/beta fold hydrolase [Phenylobacterium sp.]|uniref:alpha/beta fold hydrolase n=1 Tax=Phenylobacterium sp. TaxID=1871053 RepID=UPI00391DBA31
MNEPAPLLAIPEAPVPAGGQAEWFAGAGGGRLRAALFPAKSAAKGSVVLSTGRTEPIEKYFEVVEDLRARGLTVLVHEWRGQGLSHRELPDRLAGHANGYQAFLKDYHALLAAFRTRLPKPWWAVGHSMGGCLTLLALAHGEAAEFEGAILSAPMLGIRTGKTPMRLARALAGFNTLIGRAGAYIGPTAPAETFETNILTHDRRRWERTKAQVAAHPDLALGGPTWGWLDFAFRATAYLARPANLKSVTIPVVICSAEEERLVDNAAQRAVAGHLPQAEFINVPGAYHEILMETDTMRNIFLRALDALLGRSPPKPATPEPQAAPAQASAPPPEPAPAEVAPAAAAVEPAPSPKPAAKKPVAKTAAPKKPAAAKPASAKSAAAKSSAKAPAAKKATPAKASPKPAAAAKAAKAAPAKAAAAKPAAAKKPAAKAESAKPAATKATAAKKPATAKKPAAKKPAAPKS